MEVALPGDVDEVGAEALGQRHDRQAAYLGRPGQKGDDLLQGQLRFLGCTGVTLPFLHLVFPPHQGLLGFLGARPLQLLRQALLVPLLAVDGGEEAGDEDVQGDDGEAAGDDDGHQQLYLLGIGEVAAPLPSQHTQKLPTGCLTYLQRQIM